MEDRWNDVSCPCLGPAMLPRDWVNYGLECFNIYLLFEKVANIVLWSLLGLYDSTTCMTARQAYDIPLTTSTCPVHQVDSIGCITLRISHLPQTYICNP